jgi:hypothetical protein
VVASARRVCSGISADLSAKRATFITVLVLVTLFQIWLGSRDMPEISTATLFTMFRTERSSVTGDVGEV